MYSGAGRVTARLGSDGMRPGQQPIGGVSELDPRREQVPGVYSYTSGKPTNQSPVPLVGIPTHLGYSSALQQAWYTRIHRHTGVNQKTEVCTQRSSERRLGYRPAHTNKKWYYRGH